MPVTFDPTLEQALAKEEGQLVRELEQLPQFRRLVVVRKAMTELRAIPGAAPMPPPSAAATHLNGGSHSGKTGRKTATSIPHAVLQVLEEVGHPVRTRELIEDVRRYGRSVKAKNKVWGLSNTLSTDKRFQSVPWGDARAWWFADREVPVEIEKEFDDGGADATATA